MEMEDTLPSPAIHIDEEPVARLGNAKVFGDLLSHQAETAQQGVFLSDVIQRGDVPLGHDEDVYGTRGVRVPECHRQIVLVDLSSRQLSFNDFAEDTVSS